MTTGGFIHQIDPILGEIGGVYLWWYGLSYTLGFLGTHLWLRRVRQRIGLRLNEVYELTLYFSLGVLIGGRAVEVLFYEWPHYRHHLLQIAAYWLGGMSTHGVLLGAVVGIWLFCRVHRKPFLTIADELVIPGAFYMGMGRLGNFIDGQIVGRVTDVWWAVKFPDAEGFRHPVVLYDGLKNLLLIPLLFYVRKRRPAPGMVMAHFIFWYGFLRIFVDIYREYPTTLLGMATGQSFNIFASLLGSSLIVWFSRKGHRAAAESVSGSAASPLLTARPARLWVKKTLLALVLLFPMIIPSDWTQDVPARYEKRHPGLRYSFLYPPIEQSR